MENTNVVIDIPYPVIDMQEKNSDNIDKDKEKPMISDYANGDDDDIAQIITTNSNEDRTPKIGFNNNDFIIPNVESDIVSNEHDNKNTTITADLVNVSQDMSVVSLTKKTDELLEIIKNNKKKIINNLYIVSSKYDLIYYRYNRITLLILIISTMITFIEAIKLTLINYDTQYVDSKLSSFIAQETLSLIFSVVSLSLSTLLTILSSIVKFKNFKENMDKLKSIHDTLFNYKNLYDKQKELIKYYKISNNLTEEVYEKLQETIENYNKEIKDISVFENIRNTDILRFNKIKVDYDIKLQKLATTREIELLKINVNKKKIKDNIENNKTNCCKYV
jgi:hypothetical protein